MGTENLSPVKSSERYIILDALRGFAILGIGMANYPEFSLYTFQSEAAVSAMPSAGADRILRFLTYMFVDGKFYTIFSLLFGIGFSIIIANAARKGKNGFRIFFRRMFVLTAIAFLHLMFIWSGDILMPVCLARHAVALVPERFRQGLAEGCRFLSAVSRFDRRRG